MRVWRVCRRAHAPFDGEGARRFGGRWNARGTPLVYTSAEPALAVLEYFVNLEIEDAPGDLVMVSAELPERISVETVDPAMLPRAWRSTPAPAALAQLGTDWARSGRTAALVVPSAVVPIQRNFLLNPLHPDVARIKVGPPEPLALDPRLRKRVSVRDRRRGRPSRR